MIGLKEAATLVVSAVLFVSSLVVPVGDQGTVALKSLDGGGTHAVADAGARAVVDDLELYGLVVSNGAPLPPTTLDGEVSHLTGIAATGGPPTQVRFGTELLRVPPGARVTFEEIVGTVDLSRADLATAVSIEGTATNVRVEPSDSPSIATYTGAQESVLASNVSVDDHDVGPGFRDAGVFESISFQTPGPLPGNPVVVVDNEDHRLHERVEVGVSDFVGLVAVFEAEGDNVRVTLEGYGRIRVGDRTYEKRVNETVSASLRSPGTVDEPPTANFTYHPSTPRATEIVRFLDRSDDDIHVRSWRWTFGDGTTSNKQHPKHAFSKPGTYNVTLTVHDALGQRDNQTRRVFVQNTLPSIGLDWSPLVPTETATVHFQANVEDPDGEVVSVDWTFSDGSSFQGTHVNRTFPSEGNYSLQVEATDADGGVGHTGVTIHVDNAPPVANFTVDPPSPRAREPVTLTSTSRDLANGTIVATTWDVPGVGTRTGETVTVEFPEDGNTPVSMTVEDDDGAETTIEKLVDVRNPPPTVNVTLDPAEPNAGKAVDFIATVDDDDRAASATWTFSDDVQRTGLTTTRTFSAGGEYTATVEVEDEDGASTAVTRTFQVNHLPDLTVRIPGEGLNPSEAARMTGQELVLEAYADDPEGDPTSIDWTVVSDPPSTGEPCAQMSISNGSRLACTWPDDGRHVVTALASDDNGAVAEHAVLILVLNRQPTLNLSAPNPVNVGQPAIFDADPEDADGTIQEVRWSVDGESVEGDATLNHTFETGGSHTVVANATDDDGASHASSLDVYVNTPPDVTVDATPANALTGEAVAFETTAEDPDGPDTDLAYTWQFGDGDTSHDPEPTHAYAHSGTYRAVLTAEDADGGRTTKGLTIHVTPSPLHAEILADPEEPRAGEAVTLTVSTDGDRTVERVEWNLGDGTTTTTSGPTITHTYVQPQTRTVTATVETGDGGTGNAARSLRVTGDRGHDLSIEPHLPDGQCVNLEAPNVDINLTNLATNATVALSGGDQAWTVSADCTLQATLPAGTWSSGDGFLLEGRVGHGVTTEQRDFETDADYFDDDFLLLDVPLSLQNVHVAERENDPLVVSDGDEDPTTYHDPTEPVHVRGVLVWGEGSLANAYNVEFSAVYSGPENVVGGQGIVYRSWDVETTTEGVIDSIVPAPLLGAAGDEDDDPDAGSFVYPPGRYSVDVQTSSFLETATDRVTFIEDPEGIFAVLGNVDAGVENES